MRQVTGVTDRSPSPWEAEPMLDRSTLVEIGRVMRLELEDGLSKPLPSDMAELLRQLPGSLRVTPAMRNDNNHLPRHQRLLFGLLIQHSKLLRTQRRLPFRLWFLLWMLKRADKKVAMRYT